MAGTTVLDVGKALGTDYFLLRSELTEPDRGSDSEKGVVLQTYRVVG